MDFSETYVNMCQKATEIQERWEPEQYDFACDITDENPYVYGLEYGWADKTESTFIPRQDQLQQIYLSFNRTLSDPLWSMIFNFSKFGCNYKRRRFDSMEKIWLAFVMREKYKKEWVEDDWKET